jgi:hypothetical protein
MTSLTRTQLEQLVRFADKASAWIFIALGAFLVARHHGLISGAATASGAAARVPGYCSSRARQASCRASR